MARLKLLDVDHPFFLPRWRRIAVVGLCAGWAVLEWLTDSPFWAMLATALAVYTFYVLILTFDPEKIGHDDRK